MALPMKVLEKRRRKQGTLAVDHRELADRHLGAGSRRGWYAGWQAPLRPPRQATRLGALVPRRRPAECTLKQVVSCSPGMRAGALDGAKGREIATVGGRAGTL